MWEDASMSVMLYVSDLKQSVEFYRDKLGLEFTGYWDDASHSVTEDWGAVDEPGYARVYAGGFEIGLHPDPEYEPGRTRIKISFEVDDVDAVYDHCQRHGVTATEPADMPWGARMMTVTDPDGHEVDILEHI